MNPRNLISHPSLLATFALSAIVLSAAALPAQAALIDFNGPSRSGTSTITSGFEFQSTYQHYVDGIYNLDNGDQAHNGTNHLSWYGGGYDRLIFGQADGSEFSLQSLDLTNAHDDAQNPGAPARRTLQITGILAAGGSVQQQLTLDALFNAQDRDGNDFNHFTLSGFNGLTSVFIDPLATDFDQFGNSLYSNGLSIDNIQVNGSAPVPEPATLLLLGSGLLGFALRRERQRS